MSVRQNERGEGNLQVLNACRNLAVYTVNVCKQEKVFPKSQRWIIHYFYQLKGENHHE